jgi:hypothetical protein
VLLLATARALRAGESVDWQTGAGLRQQLQATVGVTWSGNPLRRGLTNLSVSQRVAVLLDRRVDPDQTIDFSATNTPFEQLIHGVAAKLQLGVSRVGPVLYVGPPDTTKKLATLVELRKEDIRSLSPDLQQRLLRARAWRWPMLTAPRDLVEGLANDSGIRFYRYEEQIPHDLWPAGDLPPMGFAERVSLLAAGFGKTFEFSPDGSAVRFIPIPETVSLRRHYEAGGSADRLATQFAERFPDSQFRAVGEEIEVVGLWEDHDMIDRILRGETVRRPTPATDRPLPGTVTKYTVPDTTASASQILKQIAPKFGLKLWVDPRAVRQLEERVRVHVTDVTRDELLQAIVGPTGLEFSINGDTLEVRPPP